METQAEHKTKGLTEEEKKEKILLEMHYILSNFDESKMKENKKSLSKILADISEIFNVNLTSKTIKNFIQLKETKLDEELLKLRKYL